MLYNCSINITYIKYVDISPAIVQFHGYIIKKQNILKVNYKCSRSLEYYLFEFIYFIVMFQTRIDESWMHIT